MILVGQQQVGINVDGRSRVGGDLEDLLDGGHISPDVDGPIQMEVPAEVSEEPESRRHVADNGLLDASGVSAEDGHLFDHEHVTDGGPPS